MRNIRLATRGSRLSLAQSGLVREALEAQGVRVELVTVVTRGDRDQSSPLTQIGGKGLFVTELERYLLADKADIAVHSGKDLPYALQEGLVIAGVPKAGPPGDCLVMRRDAAPRVIGTGSPRRVAECRRFYPEACYESIRGNVDTRLRKLREGRYDAVILAQAGLERLGACLDGLEVRRFSPEEFLPAGCQGILAVECRARDRELVELLRGISDAPTWRRFQAERYMLSLLQADCSAAMGIYSEIGPSHMKITAMLDGNRASVSGAWEDYRALCRSLRSKLER